MSFHKNTAKDPSMNQDISKMELNQNNNNIINKIYISPEIKPEKNLNYHNQNNINIMNINNKDNITNNNINNEISNQIHNGNMGVVYSKREDQNIKEIIRNQFVRKVYGILLVQFILTFGLILICQIKVIKNFLYNHKALYISLMILSGLVFAISFTILICYPSLMRTVPYNYIFLFLFTFSETVLLIYISILYSFQYVFGSIAFVSCICVVIFFMSCIKKISLKFIYLCIIIVAILGIIYGILALIFRKYYLEFLFCLIGAILFTLFLVYDTQKITQFDNNNYITIDDYIFAALVLYTDIIRLFIEILKMLGRFHSGRGPRNE